MVTRPVVEWMRANGITPLPPHDAELRVDEQAGTITVEQFYRTEDGGPTIHGNQVMTHLVTVPLVVPPPPGLIEAYQHTTTRLRQERNAAEAIRRETAQKISAHIARKGREILARPEAAGDGPDAAQNRVAGLSRLAAAGDVWDAMGWPRTEAADRVEITNLGVQLGVPGEALEPDSDLRNHWSEWTTDAPPSSDTEPAAIAAARAIESWRTVGPGMQEDDGNGPPLR